MRRKILRAGAALLITIAAGLLGLEICLRVVLGQAIIPGADTHGLLEPSAVPGMDYRLAANFRERNVRTDSLGIRWRPRDPAPPRHRILLIGDSVVFAGAVPYDSTFGAFLERQLSADPALGPVAVLNAGVPGYNTIQEEAMVKALGPRTRPDLVILGYCMNDAGEAPMLESGRLVLRTAFNQPGSQGLSLPGLLARSRALFFLKQTLKDLQSTYPEAFPAWLHYTHYVHRRDGAQESKQALARIQDAATRMGARLLVVVFPMESQLRAGERAAQDDLLRFLRARGIGVLDLYPGFRPRWREHLFIDRLVGSRAVDKVHLSVRGHRLAAEAIAGELLAEPRRYFAHPQ
ncbi:MAG: SGNH/GDSL hydrolase family protein [Candidatus Eisenbacteria bacterium]|nr:SGNH/GDSL hydrolase family protein [Candidatus Eisenbacteria bacterium]